MHPKLIEYLNRYQTDSKYRFDEFFSQITLAEAPKKLPYLYGIENFCLRLLKAQKLKHKICIYSDYDTDAVTATSTMYWGLIQLGFDSKNISTYAPDRFTEGYGMNTEAVDKLSLEYDLIISVDCGINSTKEAEIVLKNQKADLIITDHHHLKDKIPNCIAVLNPRLSEYYSINESKIPVINIENYTTTFEPNEFIKIKNWFKKIHETKPKFENSKKDYLSSSVTGVGVSWFCLIWLAYFLDGLK